MWLKGTKERDIVIILPGYALDPRTQGEEYSHSPGWDNDKSWETIRGLGTDHVSTSSICLLAIFSLHTPASSSIFPSSQ